MDLIAQLVRLGTRTASYPRCPFDNTELDLHFHGGADCPTCGHEFELGRNDRVLPSDHSIDEHAAMWPDTIPWHTASDEWMPAAARPDQPYPFLYHPQTGAIHWGPQNGLHDHIINGIVQRGGRLQPGTLFGRWYPTLQRNDVALYDDPTHFTKTTPPEILARHYGLIRANAPTRVAT